MGQITWHQYARVTGHPIPHPEVNDQFWVDLREEECFWIQREEQGGVYAAAITAAATELNPVLGLIVGAEVLKVRREIMEKHDKVGARVIITHNTVPPKGFDTGVQTGHVDAEPGFPHLGPVDFELP